MSGLTWEQVFIRAQVAGLAVFALSAAAYGPRRVLDLVARAGPPEAGEVVPRQLPYRGYLEQDGIPVSTPQVFSFKLEYGDGGVAWTESSQTLPVSRGQFEAALGDSVANKIPAAVFRDPFVLLSVSVGGVPLVGKQRLLTVPYAATSGRAFEADGALLSGINQSASEIAALKAALSWSSESEVVVHGMAGGVSSFGTTDLGVLRFTVIDRVVGTAISRTSTAGEGDFFTITQDGIYSIQAAVVGAVTGNQGLGVSVNATPTERLGEMVGIPTAHKLLAQFVSGGSGNRAYPMVSGVFRLHQGDQLRVQARNGEIGEPPAGDTAWARITKLLPTLP